MNINLKGINDQLALRKKIADDLRLRLTVGEKEEQAEAEIFINGGLFEYLDAERKKLKKEIRDTTKGDGLATNEQRRFKQLAENALLSLDDLENDPDRAERYLSKITENGVFATDIERFAVSERFIVAVEVYKSVNGQISQARRTYGDEDQNGGKTKIESVFSSATTTTSNF